MALARPSSPLKVIGQRYGAGMLVRYRYRIYPSPGHQKALARVFGCTRVVFNDCLRLRDACHAAGEKISDTDVGLASLAVTSDGEVIPNPRFLRAKERHLARAQRALSRKRKGSANRAKARKRVAVLHRKVREARLDHAHKTALRLIRDNQAIYAEDIAISGLARTRLARSVHDAGWSQFLRLIEEKAAYYGREFRRIGRFEPTSQVCSACGVKDGPKPLHVRQWSCPACETVHDRDVNAAKNILAAGRADKSNACGGQVSPAAVLAPAGEAGTLRGAA